jgi:hypothetical protein
MRSSAEIRIGSIGLHHSKIIPPPEHTVNDKQANAFLREAEELVQSDKVPQAGS